jgi:hypothetical protein
MKINKKALRLIDKGLSASTVSKLNESQIDVLYSKLLNEQSGVVTQTKTVKTTTVPNSVAKTSGADVNNVNVKLDPNGNVKISQLGEDADLDDSAEKEDDFDPYAGNSVGNDDGPSSDDGFGKGKDGFGMLESDNKPNPWAICHTQVGPKKSRKWERCVREIKKQLGEGKNPVSLFLENEIMKIVERNIPPRITKGDLVKYLSEQGPATAPSKPKTSPTTKPGKPGTKPQRPAHPGKNPNPGEKESPKAKKISAEKAKEQVIDVIMQLLQK